MALIYLICDSEDRIPIMVASSVEKIELLLNQYMGVEGPIIDESAEFIKYLPYNGQYADIYEGVYKYRSNDGEFEFLRYCMVLDGLN